MKADNIKGEKMAKGLMARIRACKGKGLTGLDVEQVENLLECQSALKDLLDMIATDQLIPESVSYMKRAREAVNESPQKQ